MPKGIIRFFNEARGYGFIEAEEGSDHSGSNGVYVHHSQISESGYRTLREGEAVLFDVREDDGGPVAVNVQRLP